MSLDHDKLRNVFANAGLSPLAASKKIGINYKTLSSILSEKRKIPLSVLEPISHHFCVSLDYWRRDVRVNELKFFNLPKGEVNKLLKCDDFVQWWHENGGRLENFDTLSPYTDLFDAPLSDAKLISPKRTGRKSLQSINFENTCTDQLVKTLEGFSGKQNRELVRAHLTAIQRGEPVLTFPSLDEKLRSGRRFRKQYMRVLAPIYLPDGKVEVANFSRDFGQP